MKKLLSILSLLIIISSCSSQSGIEPSFWLLEESTIEPIKNNTNSERVVKTNYVLQQKGKASIGESFIKFMDYDLFTEETKILIRERDNQEFYICGVVDQKYFAALENFEFERGIKPSCDPTKSQSGILINKENLTSGENSRCQRWTSWRTNLTRNNKISIELMCKNPVNNNPYLNKNEAYKKKIVTKRFKSETFNNFELIYSGFSSNDTINLLYREFSPQDMARQAFFQNLTYPLNSKLIRFKNLRIQLISINNESIEYIVKEQSAI